MEDRRAGWLEVRDGLEIMEIHISSECSGDWRWSSEDIGSKYSSDCWCRNGPAKAVGALKAAGLLRSSRGCGCRVGAANTLEDPETLETVAVGVTETFGFVCSSD